VESTAADIAALGRNADKVTKADISRERVLTAAAKIFSERGYAGTTMRAVAKEVDRSAGSLYYHYRSKEELIEAVLDKGINGVSETVHRAVVGLSAGTTNRDRIDAAIHAHLSSIMEFGDYVLVTRRVLGQVPAHVRRKHVRLRDAYGDFWVMLLESALKSGEIRSDIDLRLTRTFILGALNSAVEWYKPQGKAIDEVAKQFALLITDGLYHSPATESGPRSD
jgi:AcrR family transcriptional regulator